MEYGFSYQELFEMDSGNDVSAVMEMCGRYMRVTRELPPDPFKKGFYDVFWNEPAIRIFDKD
jgi:hypothetical protein